MAVELDRIALDDAGANPEQLARAIHNQLGDILGPVPVHDIARALDIEEIRTESLTSFEAAVITTPERGHGAIVVNARSSRQRQRYSIGHELGHYLNPWHKPTTPAGFECTRADMLVSSGDTQHLRQEAEANRFAIELLAPAKRLRTALSAPADLQMVLAIATDLDISKAAAVRRYVALHDEVLAVAFSRDDKVLYVNRSREFPFLSIWNGDRLPEIHATDDPLSEWADIDARDWLRGRGDRELSAQTLRQAEGYAITLLRVETQADEDDAQQPLSFRS